MHSVCNPEFRSFSVEASLMIPAALAARARVVHYISILSYTYHPYPHQLDSIYD
jgi:hypothetical protein